MPDSAILLQGNIVSSDPAGYTYLQPQNGAAGRFVGFRTADSITPKPTQISLDGLWNQFSISADTQLSYHDDSGYQIPPKPGPITPVVLALGPNAGHPAGTNSPQGAKPAHPPLVLDYTLSDGTILAASTVNGQLTGLSGTAKDGHAYQLAIRAPTLEDVLRSLRLAQAGTPIWAYSTVCIWKSVNPIVPSSGKAPEFDSGLQLAICYCPARDRLKVCLGQNHVAVTIDIDLQKLGPSRYAELYRSVSYYNVLAGVDPAPPQPAHPPIAAPPPSPPKEMLVGTTDPQLYQLVAQAFWMSMVRWQLFAPALELAASRTAGSLPPCPSPLGIFAERYDVLMSSLQKSKNAGLSYDQASVNYSEAAIAAEQGAIGALASAFFNLRDPGSAPWAAAAQWLGWVMTTGIGARGLLEAYQSQFAADVSRDSGEIDHNPAPLMMFPTPGPGDSIGDGAPRLGGLIDPPGSVWFGTPPGLGSLILPIL